MSTDKIKMKMINKLSNKILNKVFIDASIDKRCIEITERKLKKMAFRKPRHLQVVEND